MNALNLAVAVLKLENGMSCNLQVTVGNGVPSRGKIAIVVLKSAQSVAQYLSGTGGQTAQKNVAVVSRIDQGMC